MPTIFSDLRSFHFLITDVHIPYVGLYFPEMFIGFGLLDKSLLISLHMFQSLIREERLALPTSGLSYVILREPVDQVDIRSQEMPDARHLLNNEFAVMQHEF